MKKRYAHLKKLMSSKMAKIGVIGLGYVGLPLAVEMVKNGFTVYGIDIDTVKICALRGGKSHVMDVRDSDLRECLASGRFHPTADYGALQWLDAVCICVPTPLDENQNPNTSHIAQVVKQLLAHADNGLLITLESTTYPGTTEELIEREFARSGFQVGEDYFLCYSPERVDPSNAVYQTSNTPKVIGGTTPRCLELGSLLYGQIMEQIVTVSTPKVAEMCKLIENTFRSVNIAFINEMAMMAEKMGIDIWEVIRAASTKPFGFMPFKPGPGIGGHCIPLDPMYLSWKAKGYRFYSKFIDLAQAINLTMPEYVVSRTAQMLNIYAKSLNNSRVLLLGMAYKSEVNDLRESPGLRVYELFKESGARVDYYDPFATEFKDKEGNLVVSIEYDLRNMSKYDCFVVITNHRSIAYEELANLCVPIFDTRNAFADFDLPHVYKLGNPMSKVKEYDLEAAY